MVGKKTREKKTEKKDVKENAETEKNKYKQNARK